MLKDVRQHLIIQEVIRYNKVKSSELSKMLSVSEDTIRRDLKELAEQGMIRKVHGGAMANSVMPTSFKDQNIHRIEQKRSIAEKAQKLLCSGQVLLIDGGTTNLELVRLFPLELEATVFTNSIAIAHELCDHSQIETILLGGKVYKSAKITIGTDVINYLDEIHADIGFIGTRSIHAELGITTTRREEALVKKKITEVSQKVVSLVISEKIGTFQPFKVAPPEEIDLIITELSPDDDLLEPFRKKGIEVW